MFSIDYDQDNNVEYISISKPNTDKYKILYNNYNIFEIPAEQLIEKSKRQQHIDLILSRPIRIFCIFFMN